MTNTFVLIDEPGIVSYSMQELPGYSFINVIERDFVDRIDDLIHENGHHYLNRLSEHNDLFHESDEEVFYSPWRKSLRPIRAFYHAFFTFWWAHDLFKKLAIDCLSHNSFKFNEEQKQKIYRRFLEESQLLKFCLPQLDWAIENNLITSEGIEIVNILKDDINSEGPELRNSLNNDSITAIQNLDNFLENAMTYFPK